MLGVGLDGSRRIWPAHVGCSVGPDGFRRIQKDRLDDQMDDQSASDAESDARDFKAKFVRYTYLDLALLGFLGLVRSWSSPTRWSRAGRAAADCPRRG